MHEKRGRLVEGAAHHRIRGRVAQSAEQLFAAFADFFRPTSIRTHSHVYNLQETGDRFRLIDALWKGDWARDESLSLAAENAGLCDVLESSTVDGKEVRYRALKGQQLDTGRSRSRWEAVLTTLTRWHSLHK
eukprot:3405644-Pleurochrysis_carterae.AAC.1